MAGRLLRSGRIWLPAGRMSSVVTLSPTFSHTSPRQVSGRGVSCGKGTMLGPRTTSPASPGGGGGTTVAAVHHVAAGARPPGGNPPGPGGPAVRRKWPRPPRFRGWPDRPGRPWCRCVPESSGERCAPTAALVGGAWPMPMQPQQPGGITRAPASSRGSRPPARIRFSKTCREPGLISRLTRGCTRRPCKARATTIRSRNDELAQEPMSTCSTGVPSSSFTGATRSGELGWAMRGVKAVQVHLLHCGVTGAALGRERPEIAPPAPATAKTCGSGRPPGRWRWWPPAPPPCW